MAKALPAGTHVMVADTHNSYNRTVRHMIVGLPASQVRAVSVENMDGQIEIRLGTGEGGQQQSLVTTTLRQGISATGGNDPAYGAVQPLAKTTYFAMTKGDEATAAHVALLTGRPAAAAELSTFATAARPSMPGVA